MKKIFKKSNIFAFILGALIFGGIGVVSAYTILANNIGYTPKDTSWEVDNVKDAIDDLYTKANEELSFGTPEYYTSSGDSDTSRNVNANLSKGKYIALYYDGKGFSQSSYAPNPRPYETNILANKESCNIARISGYFMGVHSTSNININNVTNTYLVTVNEDNTTITANQWSTGSNDAYPQYTVLTIIPIN